MNRATWVTWIFAGIYLGLAVLGTAWGTVPISLEHVIRTLAGAVGIGNAEDISRNEQFVILHLRLPQVLLLGLVGAALSCSGAALQATFENPLADPGVLGVSGGASLGAVIAIHTGLAAKVFLSLPISAFAGGLGAALVVYSLTISAVGRTATFSCSPGLRLEVLPLPG